MYMNACIHEYIHTWVYTYIPVKLCEAEVDDIHHMAPRATPHQEIVGLNVSMYVALSVDDLHATKELVGQHENGLQVKSSTTVVEEVLQTLAQQVNDHYVVIAFNSIVSYARYANWLEKRNRWELLCKGKNKVNAYRRHEESYIS